MGTTPGKSCCKIWALYKSSDLSLIRYLVGDTYDEVFKVAMGLTGLKADELIVEDTGRVKEKCCGE
jgi:hypothetical protein